MTFVLGLASNIVANAVFWLVLGVVFWSLSRAAARRFTRSFGLARTRSVVVFVSNLWNPQASRSGRQEGYTISLHELWAAQSVDRLFGSAPLQLPEVVRGLVDALWLRSPVQCVIEVSPLDPKTANLDRNLIVVGSSARNTLRARYVQAKVPSALLAGELQATDGHLGPGQAGLITIWRNGAAAEVTLADANLAIIEKCHDPDRGTTLFFCLGSRADSSWAATEYLARHWKQLAGEFSDRDFVVCLGFPRTDEYMEEYKEPLRLTVGTGS